jgi:hypothetical protein
MGMSFSAAAALASRAKSLAVLPCRSNKTTGRGRVRSGTTVRSSLGHDTLLGDKQLRSKPRPGFSFHRPIHHVYGPFSRKHTADFTGRSCLQAD